MKVRRFGAGNRQGGTVLVISMIILLAMTLIGITGMQTTVLEEKMTGNQRDRNLALQASEAGLRESLDWIEDKAKRPIGMPLSVDDGSTSIWKECYAKKTETACGDGTTAVSMSWLEANGSIYGSFVDGTDSSGMDATVSNLPRTIIEERYAPPPEFEDAVQRRGVVYYTETTLGYGGTAQARVLVQSTVTIPRL